MTKIAKLYKPLYKLYESLGISFKVRRQDKKDLIATRQNPYPQILAVIT